MGSSGESLTLPRVVVDGMLALLLGSWDACQLETSKETLPVMHTHVVSREVLPISSSSFMLVGFDPQRLCAIFPRRRRLCHLPGDPTEFDCFCLSSTRSRDRDQ